MTFSPYGVYTVLKGGAGNVVERHDTNVSTGATTTTYCQYGRRGNVASASDSAGKVLSKHEYNARGNLTTKHNTSGERR